MDERTRRKIMDVLRVLAESEKPLGGTRIAQALDLAGKDMSQRTIRYYLGLTDMEGLTEQVGRRGRRLTGLGRRELETAYVADKVGFVAARAEALIFGMDFKLRQGRGRVVVNLSTLRQTDLPRAKEIMRGVFQAGYSLGDRLLIGQPGRRVGSFVPGPDEVVVATVCSVAVNGVMLAEGLPMTNRFGGLLQVSGHKPMRFTQIINYDGTTLDPLEIFIKGQMTSVNQAVATGEGVIGASFREIPEPRRRKRPGAWPPAWSGPAWAASCWWAGRASPCWRCPCPRAGWAWWCAAGSTPWPRWKRRASPPATGPLASYSPLRTAQTLSGGAGMSAASRPGRAGKTARRGHHKSALVQVPASVAIRHPDDLSAGGAPGGGDVPAHQDPAGPVHRGGFHGRAYSVIKHRRSFFLACGLLLLGLVLTLGDFGLRSRLWDVLGCMLLIAFMVMVLAGIVRDVMTTDQVTFDTISGALSGYLLMGILWGFAYMAIEIVWPGSFDFGGGVLSTMKGSDYAGHNWSVMFYFSFVTLTTTGYGDVTPLTSTAGQLAITEAVVGQFYMVVLVARLVALYSRSERQ